MLSMAALDLHANGSDTGGVPPSERAFADAQVVSPGSTIAHEGGCRKRKTLAGCGVSHADPHHETKRPPPCPCERDDCGGGGGGGDGGAIAGDEQKAARAHHKKSRAGRSACRDVPEPHDVDREWQPADNSERCRSTGNNNNNNNTASAGSSLSPSGAVPDAAATDASAPGAAAASSSSSCATLAHPHPRAVAEAAAETWRVRLVKASLAEDFPDIVCAVCHEVMWEPVQIATCQHMFCRGCLALAFRAKNRCPMCNVGEVDPAACRPYRVANGGGYRMMFGKLKVQCPLHRDAGCTWEGDYPDSAAHIQNACARHPLVCDYCCRHYLRGELDLHRAVCDLRPVACPDCRCAVVHADMPKHKSEHCPAAPVTCSTCILPDAAVAVAGTRLLGELVIDGKRESLPPPPPAPGCGLTMPRGRLWQHQRAECTKRLVACAFSEHGCRTPVAWDAIGAHETQCMSQHLELVSRKLALVSRVVVGVRMRDRTRRYDQITYRFGGDDGKSELGAALSYDVPGAARHRHLACWVALPDMPTPRGFVACARWRNCVFVAGGYVRSRKVTVRCNECYILDESRWVALAPMGMARNGHLMLASDEAVYALGGTPGDIKATDQCERYDPHGDAWCDIPPMGTPRRHHAGVCYNGRLYVFGGTVGRMEEVLAPSAECYDPATRRWSALRPPSIARANGRAVLVDAHVYLMGGSTLSDPQPPAQPQHGPQEFEAESRRMVTTTSVECYDIERDVWVPVCWKMPHEANSFSAKYADGRILVAGGWMSGALRTTHALTMATGVWTRLAELPAAVDKCAHC